MESRCTVIQKASPSSPKYLRRLGSILALSSALGACTLPDAQKLPLRGDLAQKQTERFNQEAGPAVEVISVPGTGFAPRSLRQPVPEAVRERPGEIRFEIGRASGRERGCQYA